ncbi:MAG: hypothetical protein QOH25_2408, partial [Acidobacteriota bacterium]|nr:hypothetical protein [Acidobacteriota bacterium]
YLGFNPQSSVWGVTSDLQQSYDGESAAVKKVEATTTHDNELGDETTTATTYLLRSSVLGGKVIAEIDELGQKQRGFVYLGNNVLAWQARVNGANYVQWEHRDANNASFRVTNSNASLNSTRSAELDPLGTNAGLYDSNPATQGWQKMTSYPGFGSSFASADTQCQWDGLWVPCSIYQFAINSGYVKNPERQRGFNPLSNPLVNRTPWRFDNAAEYGDLIDSWQSPLWVGSEGSGEKSLGQGFFAHTQQNSGQAVPLSGANLLRWKAERDKILKLLQNKNSSCYKYLSGAGFDPGKLAQQLSSQTPYDALASTNDANLDFGYAGLTVRDAFENMKQNSPNNTYPDAGTGQTRSVYYFRSGLNATIILHEAIHATFESPTLMWNAYLPNDPGSDRMTGVKVLGKSRITDAEMKDKLGIPQQPGSRDINNKLAAEGCK